MTKTKKKNLLWISSAILLVVSLFAYKTLVLQRQQGQMRESLNEQRQVMIDYWKDQGLSDEEIEEKMENERDLRGNEESIKHSGMGVVKLITGGRGAGRK